MVEWLDSFITHLGLLGLVVFFVAAALEYVVPPFPGDTITLLGGVYAVRGEHPCGVPAHPEGRVDDDRGAPGLAGGGDADAEEVDAAVEQHGGVTGLGHGLLLTAFACLAALSVRRSVTRSRTSPARCPGTGEVCQDG